MKINKKKFKYYIDVNLYNITTLSKATGLAPNTVKQARDGKEVFPKTVKKLCEAFNCEPKDILLLDEE